MKLSQRIRLKELQAEQARLALRESVEEFRRVLHERLASRTALAVGFGGGLLLGWSRRRARKAQPGRAAEPVSARARRGMPQNWLRSYFVWPFLLATARDFVLSRRPGRREA